MLVFSEQNVIKDPPFSRLDLISCRNLLIYMGGDLQKKLIPLFHYALNPGGFLFLGTSESVGEFGELFRRVGPQGEDVPAQGGCSRRPARGPGPFPAALIGEGASAARRHGGAGAAPGKLSLRELTEQALLQQVAPAGALVNGHGDILYLHGRTGMYPGTGPGRGRSQQYPEDGPGGVARGT